MCAPGISVAASKSHACNHAAVWLLTHHRNPALTSMLTDMLQGGEMSHVRHVHVPPLLPPGCHPLQAVTPSFILSQAVTPCLLPSQTVTPCFLPAVTPCLLPSQAVTPCWPSQAVTRHQAHLVRLGPQHYAVVLLEYGLARILDGSEEARDTVMDQGQQSKDKQKGRGHDQRTAGSALFHLHTGLGTIVVACPTVSAAFPHSPRSRSCTSTLPPSVTAAPHLVRPV